MNLVALTLRSPKVSKIDIKKANDFQKELLFFECLVDFDTQISDLKKLGLYTVCLVWTELFGRINLDGFLFGRISLDWTEYF
jgi:hypothetical protein